MRITRLTLADFLKRVSAIDQYTAQSNLVC